MNLESRRYVVLAGYRRRSLLPAPCDAYLILKIPLHTGDVSQEASPEVEVGATLQAVVVAEQQGNEDA